MHASLESSWSRYHIGCFKNAHRKEHTWWLTPLSKWFITLVISGHCPHKNPIYNQGELTHLLRGMNHQVRLNVFSYWVYFRMITLSIFASSPTKKHCKYTKHIQIYINILHKYTVDYCSLYVLLQIHQKHTKTPTICMDYCMYCVKIHLLVHKTYYTNITCC